MSNDQRFNVACPGCGAEVAVSRIHIGKKGRCPKCQTVFPILEPAAVSSLEAAGPGDLQPLPAWPAAPQGYAQPTPASPFAPAGFNGNGGFPAMPDDEMRLAPMATAPASSGPPLPHQDALRNAYEAPQAAPASDGESGAAGSILAGIGMMVGAVVWFVGGLFFDRIFFYPPILFILGLIAFVRGVVNLFNR
jgi:hypothetical protein